MASNSSGEGELLSFVSSAQRISEGDSVSFLKEQHVKSYFHLPPWGFPYHDFQMPNSFDMIAVLRGEQLNQGPAQTVLRAVLQQQSAKAHLDLNSLGLCFIKSLCQGLSGKQCQQVSHLLQKTALKFHHSDAKKKKKIFSSFSIQGQAKHSLLPELAWMRTFPS